MDQSTSVDEFASPQPERYKTTIMHIIFHSKFFENLIWCNCVERVETAICNPTFKVLTLGLEIVVSNFLALSLQIKEKEALTSIDVKTIESLHRCLSKIHRQRDIHV